MIPTSDEKSKTIRKPTRDGVMGAAAKIAGLLPPTPLLPVRIGNVDCWAKAETLQPIGAFKIRGAWNRLSDLTSAERANGVIAVSSGNHAQGVAWAARRLDIAATIVMPRDAPQVKLDATRALGAEVVLYDRPGQDRDRVAADIQARTGATLVHAFADPWVIEGQGSAGIEAARQLGREPSAFIVCCGGGGLSAGLALACPQAQLYPVEPVGWDMVGQSLASGGLVTAAQDAPATICDALQPTASRTIVLDLLRGRSQPGVTVTDDEIRTAQKFAFARLKLVVEPGGAAALAAALAGKVPVDAHTVILLTGGNVDPVAYARTIAAAH